MILERIPISSLLAVTATSLLLAGLAQSSPAHAQTQAEACPAMIYAAEQRYGIPAGLLMAVALTESGDANGPNPHAMNIAGRTYIAPHVEGMAQVIAQNLQAGQNSIDVGCMQINLKFHAHNFRSPYELLNSRTNVDYGARYLTDLAIKTRSWRDAVMSYHNKRNPSRRAWYGCSVWNNFLRVHRSNQGYLACGKANGSSTAATVVPSALPGPAVTTPPAAESEPRLQLASYSSDAEGPLAPAGKPITDFDLPLQPDTASEPAEDGELPPLREQDGSQDELNSIPGSGARGRGSISIVAPEQALPDLIQNDRNAGAFNSVKPLDWRARKRKDAAEAAAPPPSTQADDVPQDSGFSRVTRPDQ